MPEGSDGVPASQTLDRGIRVLEHLAATREPQSIATVAAAVGVHRSIAYRLLRTLEAHRLVERDAEGSYGVGLGVVGLSRSVRRTLQAAATPELARLVQQLGMTAFLVVRDGDEAVTVNAVEPRDSPAHVAFRPGNRHPVHLGATGLALLIPEEPDAADRSVLVDARARGWVSSLGEVIPGMRSVAAPVRRPDGSTAGALAVIFVDQAVDDAVIGPVLVAAADRVSAALG
ncbi:transcriptional regulator, IclR family [Klenkia soli]|uniref:Transcriptional regulator, IclR family n=1 Tax=Klenkia soli TaxID=1052260 RepID=A0A1H0TBP4_9ACTN|nr:IclR family transcriptional regulator [Klenkia soli]SDP51429.1 transcriptional regulator, IclR family [Klenkia soli]